MKENIIIDISESNNWKEQIIINKKYKFDFSYKEKKIPKFINVPNIKKMNVNLLFF